MNKQILSIIQSTKKALEAVGSKGEVLRLERSRSVVLSSKSHNKSMTTFDGLAVGTEKDGATPIHFPKYVKGKGWTCTCEDHKRLLEGNRVKGQNTGDNFAVSPCKHVLALCRFAWIHLDKLEKAFTLLQGIGDNLDCDDTNQKDCQGENDSEAEFVGESDDLTTGLSIEKEILWGSPTDLDFNCDDRVA